MMASFRITTPDGAVYNVSAPDGATQDEVLQRVMAEHGSKQPAPSATEDDVRMELGNLNPEQGVPTTGLSRPGRVGMAAVQGALRGGPLGLILGLNSEFGQQAQELTNNLAGRAGEGATDLATRMGASPEVAGGAGYAANVATQAIPAVAGMGVGRLAGPATKDAGRWLMRGVVKPTQKDYELGKADRAIETLLKEGISPDFKGVKTMKDEVSAIMGKVSDVISQSGGDVNKAAIYKNVHEVWQKFKNQVNNQADLAEIRGVLSNFLNNMLVKVGKNIPIQDAQKMKQGTYAQLAGKYGKMGNAGIETEKAIARGLKEGIEQVAPSVAPLNARASELMNAVNVASRAAARNGNYNPFGLALLAESPEMAAAFYLDRSPLIRSLFARGLYNQGGNAGMAIGGGLGGVLGRSSDSQ